MTRLQFRKLTSNIALGLSGAATLVGLVCLGAILWTLLKSGVAGISVALFTQMTPPPGGF
jgi:phosphate transport system permease protein